MKYHAFLRTPVTPYDPGHLAQVPYEDLPSALEHARWGVKDGCSWGAVIDDEKQIHYLSSMDTALLGEAIERVEWD